MNFTDIFIRRPVLATGEPVLLDPANVPDFHEQIGRNTKYIIHPEEVLADAREQAEKFDESIGNRLVDIDPKTAAMKTYSAWMGPVRRIYATGGASGTPRGASRQASARASRWKPASAPAGTSTPAATGRCSGSTASSPVTASPT